MPAHDIELSVPVKALRNVDSEIVVKSGGRKLGSLLVSQGSIDWDPAGRRPKVSVTWEQFAELMNTSSGDGKAQAPGGRPSTGSSGPGRRRGPGGALATGDALVAPSRRRANRRGGAADAAAIREWARDNGFAVGDRGRIRREVQDAYRAAR